MFTIVVPPDYTEELQQICGLDASQREKLISLLALAWLDWKQPVSYTHLTLPTNREV